MKIELLYSPGCPNHEFAKDVIKDVLDEENIQENINLVEVRNQAEAEQWKFIGSPTVRVDEQDIEDLSNARHDYNVRCRIYESDTGISGFPSRDQVRKAIRSARK